jgi:cytochrome c oxidase subunit 2
VNEFFRRLLFLPEQGSDLAEEIDRLHYVVIGTTMAGATAVTLVALVLIVRYRARGPRLLLPLREPSPTLLLRYELAGAGGLLALFLVWWWIGFRQYVRASVAPDGALPIYVVGKQWMWEFAYPNGASSLGVLYVPVGKPVRLVITSRDVVHSLFVPAFRTKTDAVPGRTTVSWLRANRAGRYEVFCAEYCGVGHSRMRAELVALPPEQYDAWLDGRLSPELDPGEAALVERGRRVAAEKGCLRCHTIDGTPHIGPTFKGLYGSLETLTDGRRVLVDEAYITDSIVEPGRDVARGFAPVMPSYRGNLDPAETAAVIELLRSLGRSKLGASSGTRPVPPGGS